MLGIGVGLRFPVPHAGGLPPALPGAQPLPITPAARWHPQFSQVGISNGRVVTATDLQGLAGLTASGGGPRAMTDGLGRSFWRFEGNQALEAANTLSMLVNAFAVFMVVRSHRCSIYNPFFDIGTPAQGNAVNALSGVISTGSAANLRTLGNYPRDSTTPGSEHTVVGSQMQVIGVASRSAPLGSQALFHNGNRLDVGRAGSTNPRLGAMIGYAANASQGGISTFMI